MRLIKLIMTILIAPTLAALLLVGLSDVALSANPPSGQTTTLATSTDHTVETTDINSPQISGLRSTMRISIPYGFASTFPLRTNGTEVMVKGHGSCTNGETFMVTVTVTQKATGDVARGNLTDDCIGEDALLHWQLTATATGYPLTVGPAETCGLVQTKDGDTVTDEQIWCVDVKLGDYIYLPLISR